MPRQIALGIEGESPSAQRQRVSRLSTEHQNWEWCLQAAPTRWESGSLQTQETF